MKVPAPIPKKVVPVCHRVDSFRNSKAAGNIWNGGIGKHYLKNATGGTSLNARIVTVQALTNTDRILEAFTDDDLKQFKDWNNKYSPAMQQLPMVQKEMALIARLEAAEACAENYANRWPDDPDTKAWRKVAGK